MKKILAGLLLLMTGVSFAGTIHTFSNGEVLTADNLNQAFQHIHNTMVGGHGARLVDADVSSSAAIAASKVAGLSGNVPKMWAFLPDANKACGSGVSACTIKKPASSSLTITGLGAGTYNVTLGYTATDANYAVFATAFSGVSMGTCMLVSQITTSFQITCSDLATPTNRDSGFSVIVYDDN